MSTLSPGEHQLKPDDYSVDAAKIAWGGKVLMSLVGAVGVGTELFSTAIYAGLHDNYSQSLQSAGEIGVLTVATVALADTAEHLLIRLHRK